MTKIEDGTWSWRLAKVDNHNYLMTNALTREHSFHHSKYHENMYSSFFKHTIQSWWSDEYTAAFTYTGDNAFVINKIIFCTDESAASWITEHKLFVNSTTIGWWVAVTPSNINFGSKKDFNHITLWTNDGATPITVSILWTQLWCIVQKQQWTYVFDTQNAVILGKSTNLLISSKATTTWSKVRITLLGFVETD